MTRDPGDATNPLPLIGLPKSSQKLVSVIWFLNDYNYTAGGDLTKSFKL